LRTNEVITELLFKNATLEHVARRHNIDLKFLSQINDKRLLPLFVKSQSQILQDLFVLNELGYKKNGYFVEFGATDGVSLSNTYMLEKEFAWSGILAEPSKFWQPELLKNRRAHIETKCVWSLSGETLLFNQAVIGELSTIDAFSGSDSLSASRAEGTKYEVATISLNDLLTKYEAPEIIDYLSIDTEGSEYEILKQFDFDQHKFSVITCEHNGTDDREKIFQLLSKQGYVRKHEDLSQFDDWYVLKR
jgi:FkbM family methyltransferase